MKHLKKVWLKSHFTNCCDLYDTLNMLAKKNLVYHLTIQIGVNENGFHGTDEFMTKLFPYAFTALKTLRIISATTHTQPFLQKFLQSLPNLTKCILDNENINHTVQNSIATIVDAVPNLMIFGLKMPAMNLDHLLYMKLIGIKFSKTKTSNQIHPLQIYINSEPQRKKCLAELNSHYDEHIIAIKVKSFMTWEYDPL